MGFLCCSGCECLSHKQTSGLRGKYEALSREENFIINLVDDWGSPLKTIRVHTAMEMRPLYFHLQNEKALGARPKIFKKLVNHWNRESGYTIKSYEDFESAFPITLHLGSIYGKEVTNLISCMSGSIPPFFTPLRLLERQNLVKTLIGCKPEYLDIRDISANDFNFLLSLPDALITTEQFWQMRKFEYKTLFKLLSDEDLEKF